MSRCHLWNFFSNFHFIERKSTRRHQLEENEELNRVSRRFTRDLDISYRHIKMWHLKRLLVFIMIECLASVVCI